MKITLRQPIELRSAKDGKVVDSIAEVTFRTPTTGDMVAALDACGGDQGRIGSMMRAIAARCTGLSHAQFDELSLEDGQALMQAAAGFLGNGPLTGPMPSASSSEPSASPATGEAGDRARSAS